MSRTRVRRRRIAAILLVASLGGVLAARSAGQPSPVTRPVSDTRVVVQRGDTLWDIALRLEPGADPRPLVDAIADANGIDPGSVVPGQTLVVPAA